jgi:hypothetical protein
MQQSQNFNINDKTLKILSIDKQIIQISIKVLKLYVMKHAVKKSCEDLYSNSQPNMDPRVLVQVPIGTQGDKMPKHELAESDNVLDLGLKW